MSLLSIRYAVPSWRAAVPAQDSPPTEEVASLGG